MHVLIATTGVLSPEPAVEFTRHLLGTGGRVTVTTVIEVPRGFLDTLRSEGWHPLTEEFQVDDGDDAIIQRYVDERGRRLTEPVTAALKSAGIDSTSVFREGADPNAWLHAEGLLQPRSRSWRERSKPMLSCLVQLGRYSTSRHGRACRHAS